MTELVTGVLLLLAVVVPLLLLAYGRVLLEFLDHRRPRTARRMPSAWTSRYVERRWR